MWLGSLARRAGGLLSRRAKSLSSRGRQKSRQLRGQEASSGLTAAAAMTFSRPHGHSECGKKQYKSLECKARSIAKQGGGYTKKQEKYVNWLEKGGF